MLEKEKEMGEERGKIVFKGDVDDKGKMEKIYEMG